MSKSEEKNSKKRKIEEISGSGEDSLILAAIKRRQVQEEVSLVSA